MHTFRYDLYRVVASASGLLVVLALLLAAPAQAQEFQADPAWGGPQGEQPLLGSKPGATKGDPTTKDGPGGGSPTPGTPTKVPVDGGLALLAIAGVGYAARKLRATPASTDDAR